MTRQEFEDHIRFLEKEADLRPIDETSKKILWLLNKDFPVEQVRESHAQSCSELKQMKKQIALRRTKCLKK